MARVHALARSLDDERYEIRVASSDRYDAVAPPPFGRTIIDSISPDRFASALARGAPVYDESTLRSYVAEDLRVIEAVDPDVIVGDFRLSLQISARVAGVPYVNVTNIGWSPHAATVFPVPDLGIVRWLGARIAQRVFDVARPIAFRQHARPMNALRVRHGLDPLADLRSIYVDADRVAYADLPGLVPTHGLPATHDFLGPVLWSTGGTLPDWWTSLPTEHPIVYLTLGSSGASAVMSEVVAGLLTLPVTIVVATAGRSVVEPIPGRVFVAPFVPGAAATHRAALVVCNGGSPSVYQALEAGVPVLGIPSNLDQFINMNAVASAGAGRLLRATRADRRTVADEARRLLGKPHHRQRAADFRTRIAACRPGERLDAMLAATKAARRA